MSQSERATRASWSGLKPLPEQRSRLLLRRVFTAQEYERLCRGLIPERMEDKWCIFVEDDALYIHRSWTGYCIYRLQLSKEDSGYVVSEALVNRDEQQYAGGSDLYDAKMALFLVDHLLLGRGGPMPLPPNVPAGLATELHYSHVLGAGQRQEAQWGSEIRPTIRGVLGWLGRRLLWLVKR